MTHSGQEAEWGWKLKPSPPERGLMRPNRHVSAGFLSLSCADRQRKLPRGRQAVIYPRCIIPIDLVTLCRRDAHAQVLQGVVAHWAFVISEGTMRILRGGWWFGLCSVLRVPFQCPQLFLKFSFS